VAEQFGKSAIIADLPIQPSAAYMLAAPSVPDEARQKVIELAEAGEKISVAVAQKIVAEAKKKGTKKAKRLPVDKLALRLTTMLERYKVRWDQKEWGQLANQLREFADALEKRQRGRQRDGQGFEGGSDPPDGSRSAPPPV